MAGILELRRKSTKLKSGLRKKISRNTNAEYVTQLHADKICLPFAADNWVRVIRHLLTPAECADFIHYLYFNPCMAVPGKRNTTKNKRKRPSQQGGNALTSGLTWTINKAAAISPYILERCWNHLPKVWIDTACDGAIWEIFGIDDHLRSLSYGVGDLLGPHWDTPVIPNENVKSFITVVLYLNDDFDGGCFDFINPNNEHERRTINVEIGTCLLFEHKTYHQGGPVEKGTKYMIRYNILYQKVLRCSATESESTESDNPCKRSCMWL